MSPLIDDEEGERFDSTISTRPLPAQLSADKRLQERRASSSRILTGSILVIGILYVARQVFVPVALAILFAFLLGPIVSILERSFLRRTGAILLSVATVAMLLGMGAWWLSAQASMLAKEVASYSSNIEKKLRVFKGKPGGTLEVMERTLQRVAESTETVEKADMKVRVIPEKKSIAERYERFAPTVEFVASTFIVVVLIFFLLHDREQLRDKLLRLAGRAHLTVTTQAIGETSSRISGYLLTISLVNLAFGVIVALGLLLLQVPHAPLWGLLAGFLRFIPYVGPVLSAAFPTILALAVFPTWYTPLAVIAFFLVTDQVLGGFVEPLIVGHRVGVSPIALLISAIFWGWLWGPVGLLLATPITVCLNVAGEFIPAMRVFSILFGTEDPLEDYLSFYNRLLSRDRGGAIAIADRYAEEASMEATFTDLLIPTLTFSSDEVREKKISTANDHFIKDIVREVIVRLGDRSAEVGDSIRHIVAVSVAGERLSLGTLMLSQLLRSEGYSVDYFTDLSDEELLAFIREVEPEAVFVSCSNPEHLPQGYTRISLVARYSPDVFILAGGSAFSHNRDRTLEAGASFVPSSLSEARQEFLSGTRRQRRKGMRAATLGG